ncbi:thiolase family protein [Streptomyces sp. ID05-04B]|uniref:thiolase family protein n=1 Tax=unclassified Streptomyces TaxID=2593676 RepID=UPI000D1A4534|nr:MULTISPECIES: thiolase family protein [unclassified Streptomyces]AVV45676.1 acetyl-CoA C-acyltransferase [Streptomyces sp. P3]MDX5565863.1 thiolase family protein [Streptomyces sp. ID05-04B]
MPDAVLVAALRTPIGTAFKGSLRDTTAHDLADRIVTAVAEGLSPDLVDDLILAESHYGGGVIARHAAVTAGLPQVPGLALNRHCAAGLAAVSTAAASVRAGMDRLVLAGGVNSASTAPKLSFRDRERWVPPSHPDRPDAPNLDMSITVGWNTAVREGLTRAEMDAWALRSHRNAVRALDEGRFKQETVPVDTPYGLFEADEHPRRDTSAEKLAALEPLHPDIDGFSITAGNACGANDAAAAVAVADERLARERLGLPVLARVCSWASVALDPAETGLTPVRAIPKALARAGMTVSDVDLFEINEAFASVPLAAIGRLGLDPGLVNVNGSGCSLGHPVAATGTRMVVTLVHELRRRGGGVGVASMCAGGGMGSALVLDVPAP